MKIQLYILLFLFLIAGLQPLSAQGTSMQDQMTVRRTALCKVKLKKPRKARDLDGVVRTFDHMYVIRFWGDWDPESAVPNELWVGGEKMKNTASAPGGWYAIIFDERRLELMQGQRIRQHIPPRMFLDLGIILNVDDVPTISHKDLGMWLKD